MKLPDNEDSFGRVPAGSADGSPVIDPSALGSVSFSPASRVEAPHEYQHASRELSARTRQFHRKLRRRYRRVMRRKADLAARARTLLAVRQGRRRHEEQLEAAKGRLRKYPPTTGHPHDGGRRVLSKWLYVTILGGAGILAYLLDKGALLVLLLPRSTTETIALFAVFLTLAGAHWGGHILRRRHQVPEDRTVLGRTEVALGTACVAFGYLLMVVVAAIRAADGGILPGLLFLVLGILDFSVALVASYFFTNDGVAAVEKAQRALDRQVAREARREAALERSKMRWDDARGALVDASGQVVTEAERILAAGVDTWRRAYPGRAAPALAVPAWLVTVREIASGVVPVDLDIRRILRELGPWDAP